MDLENRIQKYNSLLTDNDRKIMAYILSHKSSTIHQSITELSKEVKVSPARHNKVLQKIAV
ncbi:hypothetical protein P5G51_015285 [Virgibacillus sp. 179-BFC.A HS]|uniref:HTH rpiR-type domain-containing protein n=1 Tax=Tigheibacillus jepli TaxID=3035914 RepID=A0ABU5CJR3_9BACI|nr:hypothetical protein [Virgibacillus sp. 179-BFC.A HS]MDY0406545.1 hypothetical protein [Virgibacillus sp. 179-BFC.A HS]